MKKSQKLVLISAVVAFAVGYFLDWSGLLFLGGMLVCTWAIMLGTFIALILLLCKGVGLIKRVPLKILLLLPGYLMFITSAGHLGSMVGAPDAVRTDQGTDTHAQLQHMLQTDQQDRYSGRFITMPWRDRERLEQTRRIVESDAGSLDEHGKYAAAMILQHGASPHDYEQAYQLAWESSQAGNEAADALWKAAFDRWQISTGRPQQYGTQSKVTIGVSGWQTETPDK